MTHSKALISAPLRNWD